MDEPIELIAGALDSIAESLANGLSMTVTVRAESSGQGFGVDLGASMESVGHGLNELAAVFQKASGPEGEAIGVWLQGTLHGIDEDARLAGIQADIDAAQARPTRRRPPRRKRVPTHEED